MEMKPREFDWLANLRSATGLQWLGILLMIVSFLVAVAIAQQRELTYFWSFIVGAISTVMVFFLYNSLCSSVGRKRDMLHPLTILDSMFFW